MRPGTVVFVYRSQEWQIARVLTVLKGKVEVELCTGERIVFSERRLARISEKIVPSVAALTAYEQQVCDLKHAIDLEDLWKMLHEEQPEGTYTAEFLAGVALPEAGPASDDAMAWALFEDPVYFKRDGDVVRAGSEASVTERRRKLEAELRERRMIEVASAWLRQPGGQQPPELAGALDALKHLVLFEDQSRDCRLARRILRRAFPHDSEADIWIAWRLLVSLGEWSADENLALHRARLPRAFAAEAVEAAEDLASRTLDLSDRVDYRDLVTVAVDDRFTTEVDDALAIRTLPDGRREVYVFITDAAEWVAEGSAVDREARRRGATVYVPEGKLPMLPPVLSEGVASLCAGEERAALAFVATLDRARVVDFRIEEAVVVVDNRLTYDQVDAILAGAEHPAADAVWGLMEAADELRDRRRRGGSITLDRREMAVHVQEDGTVDVSGYRTDDPGRRLVSEWMIVACARTARWCRDQAVPGMFRAQDPPEEEPFIPLDRPLAGYELQRILRTLRKAELRAEPMPHAGLGVECYTQVTSPLRRYQDLLMHRQIKSVLRRGAPRYGKSELLGFFQELEEITGSHRQVERESRRYWTLKRLEPLCGQLVRAELVRTIGRRYLVDLVDYGLQTSWTPSRTASLGDLIDVRLRTVDARRDRLVVT